MNQAPASLPPGWALAKIGELCELNPKHAADVPDNAPVSFVPMSAVDETHGEITSANDRTYGEVRKGYTHFADGDVLWAKITPCMENGKAAVARNLTNGLGCGTTEFFVLRSRGAVLPEYLHRFMRQTSYRAAARATMQSGVGQARVPKDFILETQVPVPPLAEQRRIVEKLDELLAGSRAAREALDCVPGLLERYRQALLAAACSGRLSAQWREDPPSSAHPGVPSGWRIVRLGELATTITSGSRGWASYYADTGALFIRAQDINQDRLLLDGAARVALPASVEGQRTRVCRDDILVTITGANVGRTARVEVDTGEAYVSQHVALVRLTDPTHAAYLHLWLTSESHGRGQLLRAAYGGGKPGLSLQNVRDVHLVLPPVEEQRIIVRQYQLAEAALNRQAAAMEAVRPELARLERAVLAKGFRGDLVLQDPLDEPAPVLLDHLRSANQRSTEHRPARRRRTRT